jgi:hypothetical protein
MPTGGAAGKKKSAKPKAKSLSEKTVAQLRKMASRHHVKQTSADGSTRNKAALVRALHAKGL